MWLVERDQGFRKSTMTVQSAQSSSSTCSGDLNRDGDQPTWHIIIPIITITSDTSYDLKRDSEGTTGRDKSAPIPSSKIFSLLDRKSTLFPVLEMLPADGCLFSTNLVSCFTEHFMELKVIAEEKRSYIQHSRNSRLITSQDRQNYSKTLNPFAMDSSFPFLKFKWP